MRIITVSGPPSSGKTGVLIKTIGHLAQSGQTSGIVKFDCVSTIDEALYRAAGIKAKIGLSGQICPDHFFVSNLHRCFQWGLEQGFDFLFAETAGLCNRCAPHIRGILAVCVLDNLSGMNTPWKIGPMLRLADLVVITKSDLVSQAEKEVFLFRTRQVNGRATVLHVNGLTGQGSAELASFFLEADETDRMDTSKLRSSMPAAVCSYCLGQTEISSRFQMGNVKRMNFEEQG
ncbi:MAG: GTP-binding protein [Syntrophorhabdaceae bacterium]